MEVTQHCPLKGAWSVTVQEAADYYMTLFFLLGSLENKKVLVCVFSIDPPICGAPI